MGSTHAWIYFEIIDTDPPVKLNAVACAAKMQSLHFILNSKLNTFKSIF